MEAVIARRCIGLDRLVAPRRGKDARFMRGLVGLSMISLVRGISGL